MPGRPPKGGPRVRRPAPRRSFTDSISTMQRMDVRTIGARRRVGADIYHALVGMTWPRFFLTFAAVFIGINAVFAGLYLLVPGELAGGEAEPVSPFARAFFFSVHTLATVGYGNVVPNSLLGNLLVTVEIGFGILLIAVTSGLMFARFSRPRARILFSRTVVVATFDGVPHLMFRAANQRHNFILEATARLSLIRQEHHDGQVMRRFHDLDLTRSRNPVFSLSWLVMHRIDEESPLWGLDAEGAAAVDLELVVVMTGFDLTMSQQVYMRHAWPATAIRWEHRFVDVITRDDDGRRVLDYTRFHDTHPE